MWSLVRDIFHDQDQEYLFDHGKLQASIMFNGSSDKINKYILIFGQVENEEMEETEEKEES